MATTVNPIKHFWDQFVTTTGRSEDQVKNLIESDLNGEMTKRGFTGFDAADIREYCRSVRAWKRDLLRECVEANPGPVWSDIRTKILEEREKEHRPFWKRLLDDITTKLGESFPDHYGVFSLEEVHQFISLDIHKARLESILVPNPVILTNLIKLITDKLASSSGGGLVSPTFLGQRPKRYPVGVSPANPAEYFVVDRTQNSDVQNLFANIQQGGLHLFHGPRQSSKTTTLLHGLRLFPALQFIYMSMEDVDKKLSFFECLSAYITAQYPQLPAMQPSKIGFDTYFTATNFPKRNVVLIIDEFDNALVHPDKDNILMSLRSTRAKLVLEGALHAFVGLGTFEMIRLIRDQVVDGDVRYVSPFNIADFNQMPNFSRAEHKNLHITQAGLPDEFEEWIWSETEGKPGISVWFGFKALEHVLSAVPTSIESWKRDRRRLLAQFANTVTISRMLSMIKEDSKGLLCEVLRQSRPRHLFDNREVKAGVILAASGAVVMDKFDNNISVAAPIIRQVLLFYMDVIAAPPLTGRSAPLTEIGSLDIFQLLCIVVDNFDWNAVLSPHATKELRVVPFRTTPERQIADEQAFHTELVFGLRALLLNRLKLPVFITIAEAKEKIVSSRERLDILLTNHSNYVLELCANTDVADINAHITKSGKYAAFYDSDEVYCINFVGFDYTQVVDWPVAGAYKVGSKNIQLIHVRYYDTTAFPNQQGNTIVMGDSQLSTIPRRG